MGFANARATARAEEIARQTKTARRVLVARSALRAVPMNIINAALLSIFMLGHVEPMAHAAWFVLVTGAALLRLGTMARARRADRAPTDREITAYIAFSALIGTCWGAVPLLVGPMAPPIVSQACALVIAGMVAGAVMTSAAEQRVAMAFAVPALGLWATALALTGSVFGYLMVLMLGAFLLALRGLSQAYSQTLVDAVKTNVELEETRRETEEQSRAMASLAERQEGAARAAEEQARANAAILANMSHELRTPLNGILGMSQLLGEAGLGEEQRRMVRRIRESGETLSRLVGDILDVSRIQAGRLELVLDDLTAREIGERAERFAGPLAKEKGLGFEVRCSGDAERALRADETRIMQIVKIFLANAVRFTETGKVSLGVDLKAGGGDYGALRIEVRDTGSGVPQSARHRLFDAFSAEQMDEAIREAGTGLGLHLASRLAELMNGRVGYEPAEEGSVFFLELRLRLSSKADRYAEHERFDLTSRRLRVLAAEADPSRRSVLLGYLKSFNCVVTCAATGREVSEALNAAAYDAVVLGLTLEDCTPEDAAADIRALPSTNSLTPVVRLDPDLELPLREFGGDVYVRAPVAGEPLLEGLRRALESDPTAAASLRRIAS